MPTLAIVMAVPGIGAYSVRAREAIQRHALAALALACLLPATTTAQVARFLAPEEGGIVAGMTEVRFEVLDEAAGVERIEVNVAGRLVGTALPPGFAFEWTAPPAGLAGDALHAEVFAGGRIVQRLLLRSSPLRIDEVMEVLAVVLRPVVVEPGGAPVRGLRREDFQVLDDGEPVPITTFGDDSEPLALALLVDRSVSMAGELEQVREAAVRFVGRLGPSDRLAIWAFDHELEQLASWSDDRASAVEALRSLSTGGPTSLYDAMVAVLGELRSVPGRKLLVVLSDGHDVRSTSRLADVLAPVRDSETMVYGISSERVTQGAGVGALELLASETGGRVFRFARTSALDRALESVLDEAGARYALTFAPASNRPGEHRVEVVVRGGELEVRHRRSFVLTPP